MPFHGELLLSKGPALLFRNIPLPKDHGIRTCPTGETRAERVGFLRLAASRRSLPRKAWQWPVRVTGRLRRRDGSHSGSIAARLR
jgi:hypothetical protein